MPTYKTIRVEERVYDDLAKRQLPRESMSQLIERILLYYDEAVELGEKLCQVLRGDRA